MRISVFGMGYVGTVSAARFAELGHDVIGVDVHPGKVDMINRGLSPVVEEGLDEAVSAAVKSGRLRAVDDTPAAVLQSGVSLISVGTPMRRNGALMLDALDRRRADTAEGFAGEVLRLLAAPAEGAEMAENVYDFILKRYSTRRIAGIVEDICKRVADPAVYGDRRRSEPIAVAG